MNEGWEFYYPPTQQWLAAQVPGSIHQDLLLHGLIPHPYYGSNEDSVQWVGDGPWLYRLALVIPDSLRDAHRLRLRFESLDTYCFLSTGCNNAFSVFSNLEDSTGFVSESMFVPFEVNPENCVNDDRPDTFKLEFVSPLFVMGQTARRRPLLASTAGNDAADIKVSPFVRKAPYHFGWDWAPRLLTQGIRGNVWLEVDWTETPSAKPVSPTVELVQEEDSIGKSYYFRINGKPVFMKGANYIPLDEHLPQGRQERVREMLLSAKEAGFNMIRVWGGGIYEEEFFYDLCDSLGIYVWQDFMFACSMYPAHWGKADRHHLELYRKEAEAQVKRLRHHPCIVLWCGNNEIEVAWKNWGWQQQFGIHGQDSVRMWQEYLAIFDTLLPSVVRELDPGRPYVSTSPLSNWGAIERFRSGDNHYWGVWHGEEPFENFRTYVPRFMSEYGFQSFPDHELMLAWGAPQDTSLLRWHQKSYKGSRMISEYAEEWFGKSHDLPKLIRKGQFAQAEAYRIAIESHRTAMPRCMGTLYWQLNDCWPGPSWSTLDYALNWKPAHYMVKRLYADHTAMAAPTDSTLTLVAFHNGQPQTIQAFEWQVVTFKGKVVRSGFFAPAPTTALRIQGAEHKALMKRLKPRRQYLHVKLATPTGVHTVTHLLEEKPARLRLPANPRLQVRTQMQPDGSTEVTITAARFAKGVWLEIPLRDAKGKLLHRFSDNYFDLAPGESRTVRILSTTALPLQEGDLKSLKVTHCNR